MNTRLGILLACTALLAPLGIAIDSTVTAPAPLDDGRDAARELLRIAALPHQSDLHEAAEMAKAGTLWQAASVGIHVPARVPTVASASPGAALHALLAARGHLPTVEQEDAIARLDGAPEPARSALARFVDAFVAFEAATGASFAQADAAEVRALLEDPWSAPGSPEAVFARTGLDFGPVLGARLGLLDAAVALHDALAVTPRAQLPQHVEVPPAFAFDFGASANVYPDDVILLYDAGGDDTYLNNAGGNAGVPGLGGLLAAALVDDGGNDRYVSGRAFGINGGAFGGAGFLLDSGGHDVYESASDGTNGGAYAGAGFLLDAWGDDDYPVWGWGANGGSYPGGLGFLVDNGGQDQYIGQYEGVNGGGFLGGVGFLYDAWGSDEYVAEFYGTNGGSFAGRGFLLDGGGDDSYTATVVGVNGGSDGGVGLLYDADGKDTYLDAGGGSGTDRTVVPKGLGAGAQVDAPNPP